jgi:hypothetical protein
VDWDDMPRWGLINKTLDLGIPEPEETYSSSEHLYTDLDIPREAKGRLPRAAQTRAGLDAEVIEDLGETGKSSGRRQRPGRETPREAGDSGAPSRARRGSRSRRRTRGGKPAGDASPS